MIDKVNKSHQIIEIDDSEKKHRNLSAYFIGYIVPFLILPMDSYEFW